MDEKVMSLCENIVEEGKLAGTRNLGIGTESEVEWLSYCGEEKEVGILEVKGEKRLVTHERSVDMEEVVNMCIELGVVELILNMIKIIHIEVVIMVGVICAIVIRIRFYNAAINIIKDTSILVCYLGLVSTVFLY